MKIRPVADVTRDLLRLYTPKALREPEPKRRRSAKTAAPVDFKNLRVLAREDHDDIAMITVALSASDLILARISIKEALTLNALSIGAAVQWPTIQHDGLPALVLRVPDAPIGLKVNRLLDVSAVFDLDKTFAEPAIVAVVSRMRLRRAVGGAPITLPAVGTGPSLTDEDMGLEPDPVAQARAEAFIRAAIAYRLHQDAKAAETGRKAAPTAVHVEVPDADLHLSHVVDRGIHQELVRLASRPGRDLKPAGAAA